MVDYVVPSSFSSECHYLCLSIFNIRAVIVMVNYIVPLHITLENLLFSSVNHPLALSAITSAYLSSILQDYPKKTGNRILKDCLIGYLSYELKLIY